jgi:tRNA threonylcarbamoyl adenosine modification protein YjeE
MIPKAAQAGLELLVADEEAMRRLGEDLALSLRPGDLVGLSGPLGAGKSVLARAAIRHLADDPGLEVPSPTYTLVQPYATVPPLWHCDLYRLGDAGELEELGLGEALETGCALVEWPERGLSARAGMLLVSIEPLEAGQRRVRIAAQGGEARPLLERLDRSLAIRAFLDRGWGTGARRRPFRSDASARRYETATLGSETRILMDAPRQPDGPPVRDGLPYSRIVHLAEDVTPFVAIADVLCAEGFAAPVVHARSLEEGLLLISHLGDGSVLDAQGRPDPHRYCEAARLLARLHAVEWQRRIEVRDEDGSKRVHDVPDYDAGALVMEASLFADWYAPHVAGKALSADARAGFETVWRDLAAEIGGYPASLVLRDYHSPNLIWRDEESFPRSLGLIDFQDAMIGPQAYDLASVAQDARVDVAEQLEERMIAAYLMERTAIGLACDEAQLRRACAVMGAQRATKILGIFVRLDRRDGKPQYLRHLPRLHEYMRRNLRHPALAAWRGWLEQHGGYVDGAAR